MEMQEEISFFLWLRPQRSLFELSIKLLNTGLVLGTEIDCSFMVLSDQVRYCLLNFVLIVVYKSLLELSLYYDHLEE